MSRRTQPDRSDTGLLDSLWHEQYHTGDDLVVFRCTECGYASLSLGGLHAHIERHRGYTRFNIQLPLTDTAPGQFDNLMDHTEVLRVADAEPIPLADVDGL